MGQTGDDGQQRRRRDVFAPAPSMVVGLGASAGGIKALGEFFRHVPPEAPFAYVVILHLSPDHDSRLAEVLQSATSLPVEQITDQAILAPRRVYVIPPNRTLSVSDRTLTLRPFARPEERRVPVDMFFRTLGEAYGPRAAAVVLSGTGANGSSGLKRVKEHGGLTVAQDPAEAEYGDMPGHSIATGLVDLVLPVAEIPGRVADYHDRIQRDSPMGVEPPAGGAADAAAKRPAVAPEEAREWREILTLLRGRTGHDFSNYKPATLRRRVDRRVSVRGLTSLAEYARLLRERPEEAAPLMKDLLISVTSFFRDREAWEVLEQRIVPALFDGKRAGDQVRVWSAGCATGEEAYALAMLLFEHARGLTESPSIQVFATDLDAQAVAHARVGLYSEGDVADVTAERLQQFFVREPSGYRVRPDLREMVLFAHHNAIKDPPFSRLDLIACRNLLIYLNRMAQQRLLETFHFVLRPGGCLFLGQSETAEGNGELFVAVDKGAHVFEARSVAMRPVPLESHHLPPLSVLPRVPDPAPPSQRLSPGDLHLQLLEQYGPPSLVVTEDYMLVHASPRATRFLVVPPGEPSRDALKLVVPEWRAELRSALHLAAQQRAPVEVGGLRLPGAVDGEQTRLIVRPVLRDDEAPRGYFLVIFAADSAVKADDRTTQLRSPAEPDTWRLEEELTRVQTQLRTTIEEYETRTEEARAANEELQAMNEELRSSAEELETSKEELQSVNEELQTVNQELKIKIEELGPSNSDFQNLINSADIATVFLDRQLRVKLSTPAAQRIFNLLPTDVGRKLSDFTSRLDDDRLHEEMAQVLERLQTIEREATTTDGRAYLMRLLPYRATDDRIEGVVLTFHDVTEWRRAESRGRASEERLRLLIDRAIDYAIFTTTDEGRIDSWNLGAERMFRYTADRIIGSDVAVLYTPEDRAAGVAAAELESAGAAGRAADERFHLRSDGSRFFCGGVTIRLGEGLGFAKIARDLTQQRQADVDLQQARGELEERVLQRTADMQAEVTRRARAQEKVMDLLRKLVTAQEDERARIARDLHDQLGQQLTALRLALERHRHEHGPAQTDDDLGRALTLTREIDRQIDFLAWELRPATLDDLGLAVALPRYVKDWSRQYGIAADYQTTGGVQGRLSTEAGTVFYRVAQESLTNVVKHAHATRVGVVLEGRHDSVVLIVEDDGVGFDATGGDGTPTGIGLIGMFERASLIGANLQVESHPGGGTTVFLRCPVADADEAAR